MEEKMKQRELKKEAIEKQKKTGKKAKKGMG